MQPLPTIPGNDKVRALSLWEPWATAMALGLKENETRGRETKVRGDILICAAIREMKPEDMAIWREFVRPHQEGQRPEPSYGMALAVVELYDCLPTEDITPGTPEKFLGNYSKGRFVWKTRNLRRLETPFHVKGGQGFFFVPSNPVLAALRCESFSLC